MKKVLVLLVFVVCLDGCMNGIKQEVVRESGNNYNIKTWVWINDKIVWSHYTRQEWNSEYKRSSIPVDSIEQVKKRDYETAKKAYKILKASN